MNNESLRLFCIVANGHSGTTLLARLLNLHPDVFSFGDIVGIQKIRDKEVKGKSVLCGCGAHGTECSFWKSVLIESDEIQKPHVYLPDTKAKDWKYKIQTFSQILKRISKESGNKILCEQIHMKIRPWQYLECGIGNIYMLNLIRDPRAVVYSVVRQKRADKSIFKAAIHVSINNFYHLIKSKLKKSDSKLKFIIIKYEDLCLNTFKLLNGIFNKINLEKISIADQKLPGMNDSHIVGANGMKLKAISEIKVSTEYLEKTSNFWWFKTSLFTLPSLLFYGYPLTRKKMKKKIYIES